MTDRPSEPPWRSADQITVAEAFGDLVAALDRGDGRTAEIKLTLPRHEVRIRVERVLWSAADKAVQHAKDAVGA